MIYTTVWPLFAAEGTNTKEEVDVFLFSLHEEAVKKGQGLLFQSYSKVSVYRLAENSGKGTIFITRNKIVS